MRFADARSRSAKAASQVERDQRPAFFARHQHQHTRVKRIERASRGFEPVFVSPHQLARGGVMSTLLAPVRNAAAWTGVTAHTRAARIDKRTASLLV